MFTKLDKYSAIIIDLYVEFPETIEYNLNEKVTTPFNI